MKPEKWERDFDNKFSVEDLDEGTVFISDWGFNGESGTLVDGVKSFIRSLLHQERERMVGEIESEIKLCLPRVKARNRFFISAKDADFVRWSDEILERLAHLKEREK